LGLQSATLNSRWSSSGAAWAIIIGGYAVGFCVFFRAQIFSRFDLLFGDRGDTRLAVFIHEHVFRAMLGRSNFLSPPYFYNATNALGSTDAYLLDQIFYAPLRWFGIDPFLALLLTITALSMVGYGFLYALLRRFGQVSVVTAVFSSFLFAFANNLYVNANHLQMFTVCYVPVVAYLAVYAITEILERKNASLIAGSISGLLYGLLFSTGFYMSWFFGLGLLIFTSIFTILSWHATRSWLVANLIQLGVLGLVFIDSFVVGLVPFAMIYIPVYKAGGTREFSEYLLSAPTFSDIANVGASFLWKDLLEKIGLGFDGRVLGEQSFALTPGVQVFLIFSLLIGLRSRYWRADKSDELRRAVVVAGAVVCLALFLLTIKINGQSFFLILYKLVPGASAIRAGYRGMIVANFFAAISLAFAIKRITEIWSPNMAEWNAKYVSATLAALMIFCAVEQVNVAENSFVSRSFEMAHFKNLEVVRNDCQSFYIADEPGQQPTVVQIDAMLVSQRVGIPTINGYSGVFPAGWYLYDTADADYETNARAWAVNRGISNGLCRFDLANRSFTHAH
jgi:hypothetical protein